MADDLVLDAWAGISHKRGLSGKTAQGWAAPTWIGDHRRRLTAYVILQAYLDNCARHFAAVDTVADKSERREYGDAALLVHVARQKLLGEDPQLVVDAADTQLDPEPGPDDEPEDAEALALRRDVEAAVDRQEWLRAWARDERLRLKMVEVEDDAIGLGDGVYVLGWATAKRRARLRIFDPGFYFPVLDDGDEDDFPKTVHIAWELPPDGPEDGRKRVRRITYRLVRRDEEARLNYHRPDDDPATMTCLLSDGIFTLRGTDSDVTALEDSRADWLLNEEGQPIVDVDLQVDFIPVIHLPNTVGLKEHYGRSLLVSVAQILDDMHALDTDISKAAATTGSPPISVSGALLPQGDKATVATYGPGQLYRLADGGRMDVVDTSAGLVALQGLMDSLLTRLSTNARVPGEVLGRVKASDVASGFLMALSFGPLQGLVEDMRLVRDEKYRLLLKFVQRMAIQYGELEAGPALDAFVSFGSYMPSDLPGVVDTITRLLAAKAISTITAVTMLVEAGLPIEDAGEEVERIRRENFEAAVALLEASGDEDAVRSYLDLEGPPPEPPQERPAGVPPGGVVLPQPTGAQTGAGGQPAVNPALTP
jgi:hypothetical protein